MSKKCVRETGDQELSVRSTSVGPLGRGKRTRERTSLEPEDPTADASSATYSFSTWPLASYFISLNISFLIYKDTMITLALSISQGGRKDQTKNKCENMICFAVLVARVSISIVMEEQDTEPYRIWKEEIMINSSTSSHFSKDSSALI